jgi:hypothetical protein
MNSPEKENPTFNEHDNIATDAFGVKIDRESISGWLVVFLYLGLGFGSVGTIIYNLASVLGQGLNVPYTLLLLTPAILIFITGISAIVAFHKRRPNAVSLAKTSTPPICPKTVALAMTTLPTMRDVLAPRPKSGAPGQQGVQQGSG